MKRSRTCKEGLLSEAGRDKEKEMIPYSITK